MTRFISSLSVLASLTALTLLPTVAFAQNHVQELRFEDDNVEGELLSPSDTGILGLADDTITSLIKVREDFIAEAIKSAESL